MNIPKWIYPSGYIQMGIRREADCSVEEALQIHDIHFQRKAFIQKMYAARNKMQQRIKFNSETRKSARISIV